MASGAGGAARSAGVFGWNYNRANYKFDQTQRWQRYTTGRKMAMAQVGMFRQDITDLAGVSMGKLKVYGPVYGIVTTVCVTVLVEGRSGLKFPGPPVFISQIYLHCLAIGMSFIALAAWLLFHSSMRAQVACVQLRTRKVRVPVPTQRMLDGSRKLLSTYEEQGVYDIFRVPFVMPNGAYSPENSDAEEDDGSHLRKTAGYNKGGVPGVAAKLKLKVKEKHAAGATYGDNSRMPGFTPGHPSWFEGEMQQREDLPGSSPSGCGIDGPSQPYEHFELLRQAQKEWWSCEAYMRVCFLFGMMHLVTAFSYWITLHNICELGMIWCSNLGAAGLTAGVWIMFRMDVLPEHGGMLPVEIGGPFVASIALGMMYGHSVTPGIITAARVVAGVIIIMHILLCFRMFSVSRPAMGKAHHEAKESGGRLFNKSASCDSPSWLPSAFQHVMYLVAPPKTVEQLQAEGKDRDNRAIADEALAQVDMMPWRSVRVMIFMVALSWTVQLTGHVVECVMGERMLVSNPGAPPWSRTGMWYGWEHGPVTSKHYAHVTPMRGHWAWQKGWGPQGQQEIWASDMFGFAPEADAFWSEDTGPEPKVGAAGLGENTWSEGVLAYGQSPHKWGPWHQGSHDWSNSGNHRRLDGESIIRAVPVPVSVQWPDLLEPDHLACARNLNGHAAVALSSNGLGASIHLDRMGNPMVVSEAPFELEGIADIGFIRSATLGPSGLTVVTGSGGVANCASNVWSGKIPCALATVPPLPNFERFQRASAAEIEGGLIAAIERAGEVALLHYSHAEDEPVWKEVATVTTPSNLSAVNVAAEQLLVTAEDGTVHHWRLSSGLPVAPDPINVFAASAGRRTWQSSCLLPTGKAMGLASSWRQQSGGAITFGAELFV